MAAMDQAAAVKEVIKEQTIDVAVREGEKLVCRVRAL